jgi:hypothetical protein
MFKEMKGYVFLVAEIEMSFSNRSVHNMRRTISSNQTFLMKIIFPMIGILVLVILTFISFLGSVFKDISGNPPPPENKWVFLFFTLISIGFFYWFGTRLKRVSLDSLNLYISNYQREIIVPLIDVEKITENRWIYIHSVTIHFFHQTEFGSSIMFMPEIRRFAFFSSHPIVAEIRAAVEQARGATSNN